MTHLERIAAVVDRRLAITEAERRGEGHGIWRPAACRVRRLGLALEPGDVPDAWLEAGALDALVLHRPWGIGDLTLPEGVGVLACHRAFDAWLTTGYDPPLARALELHGLETFEQKDGRPLGMAGVFAAPLAPAEVVRRLVEIFGGVEDVHPPARPVERVAVARAMSADLVEKAHARGADLYVTGQLRAPGLDAVARTGVGVAAVGHRRSERFGLRVLAGLLRRRFSALRVLLAGGEPQAPHERGG